MLLAGRPRRREPVEISAAYSPASSYASGTFDAAVLQQLQCRIMVVAAEIVRDFDRAPDYVVGNGRHFMGSPNIRATARLSSLASSNPPFPGLLIDLMTSIGTPSSSIIAGLFGFGF